ncbi:feruloyl-CoA synthase [Rhabdaerophilum calidifontis]|uniref:feruloyl-CoA synthase n=1 Tax=Rhabdaerophilum calidifontis TaxID=2604328 RepID=UPI00123A0423|nr:feruloyl-CoA synthase [Rhabdaerophilum calidifontis]
MNDVHDVPIGPVTATIESRPDGSMLVRATEPPPACDARLTDRLHHWAAHAPERAFLAERDGTGAWRRLSFAEAEAQSRRIGAALLARNLSAERPIAILSGNDTEQGLLALAAMRAGIPFAPISPAYSLISGDFAKLRAILALLTPGLVFVARAAPFARAIAAAVPPGVEIVATSGTLPDRVVTPFTALLEGGDEEALATAEAATGPDTIAKILFTSGSTGQPKGVINTQAMLCANQAMLRHWLPFVAEEPPVLVDWLPWHHTFGGNHNFGFALANGGTLHIDHGKPVPGGIDETIRNLKEIAPTIYFNVPKGFEELVIRMRDDDALRRNFFSRLSINFYAGASLPAHVAEGLDALARRTIGKRILMMTGLGATETAPAALVCSKETARPGRVGLPLPGLELKLVPNAGKLEARIKGPTVTPGYWRNPEQTAKAFDAEGFYCFGDALKFADPTDIRQGFVFDGRVSEDFKLATGTWVSVGPLRAGLIAAFAPLVRDAVIAGHDRDDVTALIFPDMAACRAALGAEGAGLDDAALLAHPALRARFAARLAALRAEATGSSNRVQRLMLLAEPPSLDASEITDKGSINQRAVLARRAALVEALYAEPPSPAAILPGDPTGDMR